MQDSAPEEKDILSSGDFSRSSLVMQLAQLEEQLEALRIQYEQFFSGILPRAPEKMEADIQRSFRRLSKLPSRHAEVIFKARALRHRLGTYTTYWRRIEREREQGTFRKDLFKARIHEQAHQNKLHAGTKKGIAEESLKKLFNSYSEALERKGAENVTKLDFQAFRTAMLREARAVKELNPDKKVSFAVAEENGQVKCKVIAK